ncbi:cytochrome P450 [Mycena maculata]|uniref:Cytochrome P450 n=1 Tax=Mycena maculata TaxID=230809 RepID=A0AAD7K0S5_9AGAR|nr:cytochrome P450 [Mycena maculata]
MSESQPHSMASTFSQYLLIALVSYTIWRILRRVFKSSVLDNIPGPQRHSILTGNLAAFHDPDGWEFHEDLEQNYGQVVKVRGFLGTPHLFVFDSVALHSILVQDADVYEENPIYMKVYSLLWGPGILSTVGDDHRRYRKIMTPAFATGKLREMIPIFYEVAEEARDGLIAPFLNDGPSKFDLNNILNRTSLEMIGRTGIGYSFDRMLAGKEANDKYAETLKELLPTTFKLALLFPFLPHAIQMGSAAFRRFMVNIIPSKTLHQVRDMVDFMERTARQLVEAKKEAVRRGHLDMADNSKDIMTLLLKGNLGAEEGMFLTDDELVAQTGMIISAATDTTSSALDRIFHILTLHPDVQERLRDEIVDSPERMDYEGLGSLPYLDAFIYEVLRLYPPVTPVMFRETVEEAILPLSKPITGVDGSIITSIPVPKGTTLYVAIAAANHNKQIWGDDALEFKPERWANGKAAASSEKMCGIYGNMMTFLGGGRSCIGFQFSLLEIKVVLSVFLRHFKFSSADGAVRWKMSGIIAVPSVHGNVQLPMTVERLNEI